MKKYDNSVRSIRESCPECGLIFRQHHENCSKKPKPKELKNESKYTS